MKEEVMECEWVIGVYKGDRAKSVRSHADAGIGYFIREERGKATSYEVEAAFRRPIDGPRPDHLLLATEYQAEKLDEQYQQRHGLRDRQVSAITSTPNTLLKGIQPSSRTQLTGVDA